MHGGPVAHSMHTDGGCNCVGLYTYTILLLIQNVHLDNLPQLVIGPLDHPVMHWAVVLALYYSRYILHRDPEYAA